MNLARLASASPGRKLFVPKNGRRPILTDEWHTIVRRRGLAERLRTVLYGGQAPKAPGKRMTTWMFLVREFVRQRDFRYVELLVESRLFFKHVTESQGLRVSGPPSLPILSDDPTPGTCVYDEEYDLDLLKAFQQYLYSRRTELETWRNRESVRDPSVVVPEVCAREAKELLLLGICPGCGGVLPCEGCGTPVVALDGRGGVVPVLEGGRP